MRAELTKSENNLLTNLLKDFETKVAKSKKLSEEHHLILTLAQKTLLSESDAKKLKSLLAFEQSKITARENKKKAKKALELHENEKKEIIESRYRRFGIMIIESLKKLPEKKATISLSDFLLIMLDDENLNEKDKTWLGSFLQNSSVDDEPKNDNSPINNHTVPNQNIHEPVTNLEKTTNNFS